MDELKEYLNAREHIRAFYEDVVWVKLEKKIDELCEEINNLDLTTYNALQEPHAIPYLKNVAIVSLWNVETELAKEEPKNLKELTIQEMGVLEQLPEVFKKVLKQVYKAFLPKTVINDAKLDAEGFFQIHKLFQKANTDIRYPNGSPYIGTQEHKAPWEFFEFNTGVAEQIKFNRNFHAHSADFVASKKFSRAGRKVYDPLTDIEIPSNYIMLANLSMGCVYEIIELMQIWIDSKKIGKKNSSK